MYKKTRKKRLKHEAFRAACMLFGPLVFYELCTEAAAAGCSLFAGHTGTGSSHSLLAGSGNALFVTGAGAALAFPFLFAVYRALEKMQLIGQGTEEKNAKKTTATRTKTTVPETAKARPCRNHRLLAGCFFSVLAGIGSCLCLNMVLQVFLPPSEGWSHVQEAIYQTPGALRFLVTVVLTPLTEELIFRGFIHKELRRHMGIAAAVIFGALLFGLYHGNLSQGLYAFLTGLCLELVTVWSGRLAPAVLCHAAANATAAAIPVIADFISHRSEIPSMPAEFSYGAPMALQPQTAVILSAAGLLVTLVSLYKTKEVFEKA